jgi:glyoxylase-like metal-dependent hydrolase (beta-lactamase superfamily II)
VADLEAIDLHFDGLERAVGCYLLETDAGLALHDCGPTTTIPALEEGLAARGVALQDVRHLLLSHIHLDHAGAAGTLVREHPDLQVYVSEIGAPHLVDPSRLERSARRLWGEDMDRLFGELAPVPERNIVVAGDVVLGLDCFASPGHASHHVCYFDPRDGTAYTGDTAGIRIPPSRYVAPISPPPDIDLDAWHRSLDAIELRGPQQLALSHFGVVTDVWAHLERMRRQLFLWATRVRAGADEDDFIAAARAEIADEDEATRAAFETGGSFWQSYLGLRRYWDKQAERAS